MSAQLGVVVIGHDDAEVRRSLDSLSAATLEVPVTSSTPGALGDALDSQLDAEFVAVVRAGDRVARRAVELVRDILGSHPDADIVYGDHDRIDSSGRRSEPFHKPAWSPERLWGHDYLGSMTTYRSAMLRGADGDIGVARSDDVAALLHGLALGVARRASVVVHVPRILSHRFGVDRNGVTPARLSLVQRHFDTVGFSARAVEIGDGLIGFEPVLTDPPRVSVIIPTGGSRRTVRGANFVLVDNAIRSLVDRSTYPDIEIVVVVDANSTSEMAERLAGLDDRVLIVKDDRPFNFAAACNLGVARSSGSVIVLLNDDTEVVTEDWIERLVALSAPDDMGAVGVKLLYADGRLQHGGVASRSTGPDHLYHGYPGDERGHGDWLMLAVNCFAVTGACLGVRRDRWLEVGGMDEAFPLNYNDIDLCLRLQAANRRTVVDNQTVVVHLETSSREAGSETWEVDAFRRRWETWIERDPFDNPNLVSYGLFQIPPPSPLIELAEQRGRVSHPVRRWTRTEGFGIDMTDRTVVEAVSPDG